MRYKQPSLSSAVRFEKAPLAQLEHSKMYCNPRVYTTYNAGDIVPIFCEEVLPHSTFSVGVDFINRLLSATIKPTMGTMQMDIYAFFVPNRVVNESWKNVQGENTSGYWSAPEVELAPLYKPLTEAVSTSVSVPVGSIADYYGFPTQAPIPVEVLSVCNDLKFRGYIEIYNNYFRSQNYEAPINYSKLNIYEGFFSSTGGVPVGVDGEALPVQPSYQVSIEKGADGSFPDGALLKAVYGDGNTDYTSLTVGARVTDFSALGKPLKANKLHDYFTSGLPSPQKGSEVYFGIAESAPILASEDYHSTVLPIDLRNSQNREGVGVLQRQVVSPGSSPDVYGISLNTQVQDGSTDRLFNETNAIADLSTATGVSINDLRIAAATQQVYEILAKNGSRYLEALRSLFGIEAENPFKDIPTQLGHIRRELDLYQVAQTSATVVGETPQGSLSGFGYTAKDGHLFSYTSLEHGYIHILAVVRHRNIYSTYLAPDNFRMRTLDFYLPPLANIGEQPLRKALLNPFTADSMEKSIAFQEAWAEYRYSPDRVSGYCRTGLEGGLDIWTYADEYHNASFDVVNGAWLKSNSQEVLDRTLAVTSEVSPQFIAMFEFKIEKQLPMPIYSVPGMDII